MDLHAVMLTTRLSTHAPCMPSRRILSSSTRPRRAMWLINT